MLVGSFHAQAQHVRINLLNVVPEIQLVGTAGSVGMMLLGLGFYIKKKRQKQCL